MNAFDGSDNSRITNFPPGFSTRFISLRQRSRCSKLRTPNPTEMRSKDSGS